MLLQNEWRHDTRVIREAESLAAAGHDVTVVCRALVGRLDEKQNGVVYRAIPHRRPGRARETVGIVFTHARVMLAHRRSSERDGAGATLLQVAGETGGAIGRLALAAGAAFVAYVAGALGRHALAAESRATVGRLLEPYLRLHDFAYACGTHVEALRPDVVHAHDLLTLSCGSLVKVRAGAKLVYDAHELETESNYSMLSPSTRRAIASCEALLIHHADAVCTVSESIADWLARRYAIVRPLVILNAPQGRQPAAKVGIRERLGVGGDTPLAVYVGSVTYDRGLEQCVRALSLSPALRLATVGPKNPDTVARLTALAAETGVSERLDLLEAVPPVELIPFISSADCSVIPIQNASLSLDYAFPNKLLESVVAGVPVVAADLTELRRFLEAVPVGLIVDQRDPASIAAAIDEIVANPHRYRPTPATIDRVLAEYGWNVQEQRLCGLYERLAAKAGR